MKTNAVRQRDHLKAWEDRNYRDPDDFEQAPVDWADFLERCAIALDAMKTETPQTAYGMVYSDTGRVELEAVWRRAGPANRQLRRRQAAVILGVSGRRLLAVGSVESIGKGAEDAA